MDSVYEHAEQGKNPSNGLHSLNNSPPALLVLGSPVLAAYSVALTWQDSDQGVKVTLIMAWSGPARRSGVWDFCDILNGRWMAARFKHHEYDWPSRMHIAKALSLLENPYDLNPIVGSTKTMVGTGSFYYLTETPQTKY
ncbi:hypothetical protein M422DRAFT_276833 [Sphaerobolus stellatus SS14]|uniref:Uncharacterized protein n=1 Tax=Sphaerobolus stellatus (strain SS14) TaxID=990650 RepID=A0A0C9TLF1_SPHS4|nr:hypothetical protein M422DRAFT_276833 [Sphaerobolus stellatus SS14]